MATLTLLAAAVFALNIPFGWWRAGVRRLSPAWFIAIHAPVAAGIALRIASHVPFRLATLPVFVAAFGLGQWTGGRLRREFAPAVPAPDPARAAAPPPPPTQDSSSPSHPI